MNGTPMWLVLQAWPERAEGWAVQDVCATEADARDRIAYYGTYRPDWDDLRFTTVNVQFPPHPGPTPHADGQR